MLKVVHIVTSLFEGGAQQMLSRLVQELDRDRFRPVVVSLLAGGELTAEIREAGIECHDLGVKRGQVSPRALRRLRRLLREAAPDLVSSWLYHADLAATLAMLRMQPSCPLIWNVRCSKLELHHYPRTTGLSLKALARLSRRPVAVIANSHAGKSAHIDAGYRPRRWEVIHNGVDTTRWHPDPAARVWLRESLGLPATSQLVIHAARDDPKKDHGTLLEAFSDLLRANNDLHLLLAGAGIDERNIRLCRKIAVLEHRGQIHLLGPRRDLPRVFAGVDLAVLTSAFGEGCPSVLAEAMACGTPCVTTDVGDAAWVVGETGRVVEPRDSSTLNRVIGELLGSPETRGQLGIAARERVVKTFPLERTVEQFAKLYAELGRTGGVVD